MKRYEIQEMVSQSEQGVTYLAYDKEAHREVALRRFFPFGREAAGLDAEQQNLYRETSRKLMGITHTNLRFVMDGDVDPSDGTPYLATEWIEGNPLGQILAGTPLDPARTIDIVRCALEVSLELSAAFGQQAIWVETGLNDIIVGNVESDRGYTFWVCPLRCFNVAPKLREVSSLAQLAEELIGWTGKLYSKEAAGGFGGWVKDMKSTPDISVEEALKQLNALLSKHQPKLGTTASSLSQPVALVKPTAEPTPASTAQSTPPTAKPVPQRHPRPTPKPVPRPVARPAAPAPVLQPTPTAYVPYGTSPTQRVMASATLPQAKSKGISGALAVIAVCLAIASVFGYLVIQNRIKLREQLAKNAAIEKAEAEAKNPANANQTPQSVVSPQPIGTGSAPVKPTPVASGPVAKTDGVPVFLANQVSEMRGLGSGKPVKLTGTLVAVREGANQTDDTVQLWFSEPHKKGQAFARAVASNFEGALSVELFQKYVGKRIVIEGVYIYDKNWQSSHRVDFTRADQVRLSADAPQMTDPIAANPTPKTEPPKPGIADVKPAPAVPAGVLSPLDTDKIMKMNHGAPVKVQGRLQSVGGTNIKGVILLHFAEPDKGREYVRGWASEDNFKGKLSYGLFKSYIGKTILIDGKCKHMSGRHKPHVVQFNSLDQIKEVGN